MLEARNDRYMLNGDHEVPLVVVRHGGSELRVQFDNFTHQSGQLRAFVQCPNKALHGASCRLYRQVNTFPTRESCMSYLAAWADTGKGLRQQDGVSAKERHRRHVPPADAVEAWLAAIPP